MQHNGYNKSEDLTPKSRLDRGLFRMMWRSVLPLIMKPAYIITIQPPNLILSFTIKITFIPTFNPEKNTSIIRWTEKRNSSEKRILCHSFSSSSHAQLPITRGLPWCLTLNVTNTIGLWLYRFTAWSRFLRDSFKTALPGLKMLFVEG